MNIKTDFNKEYKSYREKINSILKNKKNVLLGDFTIYYDPQKRGIIILHFTPAISELYRKQNQIKENIKKIFSKKYKLEKIDLGKLK